MSDSLGDRMKRYESACGGIVTPKTPIIIRVDGRAFHTLTKQLGCGKPFDDALIECMAQTAVRLCTEIQGARMAYVQSDEISIVARDDSSHDAEHWFGGKIQKIASITASVATATFNDEKRRNFFLENMPVCQMPLAYFDARVLSVPDHEVTNYFIWRQQDWIRNSLQMLSRSHFSHKQLHGKGRADMHEMLHSVGVNWADLDTHLKNGYAVVKSDDSDWLCDDETPVFSENREYIDRATSYVREEVLP